MLFSDELVQGVAVLIGAERPSTGGNWIFDFWNLGVENPGWM